MKKVCRHPECIVFKVFLWFRKKKNHGLFDHRCKESFLHWIDVHSSLMILLELCSSKNLKTTKIGNSSLYFWIVVHVWYHDNWSNKFLQLYKRNANQDQPIHNILQILQIMILSSRDSKIQFFVLRLILKKKNYIVNQKVSICFFNRKIILKFRTKCWLHCMENKKNK